MVGCYARLQNRPAYWPVTTTWQPRHFNPNGGNILASHKTFNLVQRSPHEAWIPRTRFTTSHNHTKYDMASIVLGHTRFGSNKIQPNFQ